MYFYTQEQEDWLIENVDNYINSIGLSACFNETFKTNRSAMAIRAKIKHLLPHHKYSHSGGLEKGFGKCSFSLPVGTERWKDGYLYVKVADNPLPKNFTVAQIRENWVVKHRLVWESAYGKIPDGKLIIFLDGDRSNFDLENLYCIDRKITTVMMRNKWFTNSKEHTLAAIKWCELFYARKTPKDRGTFQNGNNHGTISERERVGEG